MTFLKKIFPLVFLGTAAASAQYTDQINSNRPGESMSAFAVGKTVAQIEAGTYGIIEEHDVLNYEAKGMGFDLTLRYGLILEELELIADMQYQFDQYSNALETFNRNDFRQFTIGAKYLIFDPDKNYKPEIDIFSWKANRKFKWRSIIPAVSAYVGGNFLMNDNPYTFKTDRISPKFMLITQNHFGKWVWVNNIIADKFLTDYPSIGLISTLTRGFNERWSGFLEFQGYKSDFYADGIVRIGAAHLLNSNLQIDASVSTNFKTTPSILYGGIGISWRFDANYQDIVLFGEGDREEELKQQQAKEKDKKAKRRKELRERRKKRLDDMETPSED
jgi:hypothetical protein